MKPRRIAVIDNGWISYFGYCLEKREVNEKAKTSSGSVKNAEK